MPNNYNSSFTGQHNDQYDERITDLENTRVNRSGDRFTGSVYIGNLNDNAYTDFNIQRLGTNGDTQNLFMCDASDGTMSHIWRVVNSNTSSTVKINLCNDKISFSHPLHIEAQNSTNEGGEIVLHPATSSYHMIYLDSYQNYFRVHDGSAERFKVNMTNGQILRGGISSSWYNARDNAILRMNTVSGYAPAISLKTTNGSWEISTYDNSGFLNQLMFCYVSDSNYNSANNSAIVAKITPAGAFTNSSKREYKENIQLIDYSCLDIINSIKVCSFNMKGDDTKDYRIGFIADDTDARVAGKNHDIMDLQNCIGVLIKAVQELSQEVEELKKRLGE